MSIGPEADCVLTDLARNAINGCKRNSPMKGLLAANRDAKMEIEVPGWASISDTLPTFPAMVSPII
jgi:hypothetical protein